MGTRHPVPFRFSRALACIHAFRSCKFYFHVSPARHYLPPGRVVVVDARQSAAIENHYLIGVAHPSLSFRRNHHLLRLFLALLPDTVVMDDVRTEKSDSSLSPEKEKPSIPEKTTAETKARPERIASFQDYTVCCLL